MSPRPDQSAQPGHDIIVIGASAGGVEALRELIPALPADLPAALFVVVHTHPWSPSTLPEILSYRGSLRATHAIHGEAIEHGRVYVAPPDNHLIVRPGMVQVVRGPRENNQRPSVDALFRSASRAYGPRVVGVVLTGHLDCGTAGMISIKARNGLAIVQEPREARAPEMPQSVLRHVQVDHVATIEDLVPLLVELASEAPDAWPEALPPALLEMEGDELGMSVQTVCPHCMGALTMSENNGFQLFRCHVGHSFSPASIVPEQGASLERNLWAAVRALEETAAMDEKLAASSAGDARLEYERRAAKCLEIAQAIRSTLLPASDLSARS